MALVINKDECIGCGSCASTCPVGAIKEADGKIFWVDADPKLRYERIQSGGRNRIDDRKSFEEFVAEERREISPVNSDPASVNLGEVSRIADVKIENNFDDESAYIDFLLDRYFSER